MRKLFLARNFLILLKYESYKNVIQRIGECLPFLYYNKNLVQRKGNIGECKDISIFLEENFYEEIEEWEKNDYKYSNICEEYTSEEYTSIHEDYGNNGDYVDSQIYRIKYNIESETCFNNFINSRDQYNFNLY